MSLAQSSCTAEPSPSSSSSESETPFDVEQSVRDLLEDHGIKAGEPAIAELVKMVRSFGEVRSAKLISRFFACLPRTPGAEAIERIMLGPTESIRAAAKKIGCEPSTILRAERNFWRLLGLQKITQHPPDKLKQKSKSNDTNAV